MHYLEAVEKEQDKCQLLFSGGQGVPTLCTQCLTWVKTSDKEPVQNHDLDLLIRRTRDFDDCVFAIARYDGTWWIQDHAKQACSSWVEMETPPDSWADLSGKQ
jgi:hypothetical protein